MERKFVQVVSRLMLLNTQVFLRKEEEDRLKKPEKMMSR